jgi:hypothetical protein
MHACRRVKRAKRRSAGKRGPGAGSDAGSGGGSDDDDDYEGDDDDDLDGSGSDASACDEVGGHACGWAVSWTLHTHASVSAAARARARTHTHTHSHAHTHTHTTPPPSPPRTHASSWRCAQVCPPGCDPALFDAVLLLRERRLDEEQGVW